MMMSGMAGGMVEGLLLAVSLLLGFAYILWVIASKESGNVKLIGQVISAVIAVLAVVILLGGVYGSLTGKAGMCGAMKGGHMGSGMMEKPGMMQQK